MTVSRAWTFWAFIALLVVLDFVLHIAIGLGATAPDLLTVALLLAARRLSSAGAAALGLVFGLLRDALSLIAFGAEAVTMTLLGYGTVRDYFLGEGMLFIAGYLFVGKWLHETNLLPDRGSGGSGRHGDAARDRGAYRGGVRGRGRNGRVPGLSIVHWGTVADD